MRRRLAAMLTLVAAAGLAVPASAGTGTAGTYKGKATSLDRSFGYGAVTMKVRGGKVTNLKIEAVTTTGCGGFMTLVFAPKDASTQIVEGSSTLKGGKLSVTYRPDKTVEEQTTTISARVKGSRVTGTFRSGDLCGNEGRFSAKR